MSSFKPTPEQIGTAWHEGGHVAAAWTIGGDESIFGPVTIAPTVWRLGSAQVAVPEPSRDQLEAAKLAVAIGLPVELETRRLAEASVTVLLAGRLGEISAYLRELAPIPAPRAKITDKELPLAAELALRTEVIGQWRKEAAATAAGDEQPPHDDLQVEFLLEGVTASAEELKGLRAYLDARAWTLVTTHPLAWPLIEAVAGELLIHETLTREEVLAIIHRIVDPRPSGIPAGFSGYY